MDSQSAGSARRPSVTQSYVAFVDVLGFSNLVEQEFETALGTYHQLVENVFSIKKHPSAVSVQVFSDSMLLTSSNLIDLVKLTQTLNFVTLVTDCLVRGGIGFGQHSVETHGRDTLVVSQALTRAVAAEKRVRYPCVELHESVVPERWVWVNNADTFLRPILYFEGVRLVNPFNIMWGLSAQSRVRQMRARHPEHSDKYDWFLRLYDAVAARDILRLVPPEYASYYAETGSDGSIPSANGPRL